MPVAERATPVAAVIAALTTLACCVPFGFVGAAGLLGVSVRVEAIRPWLLAASAALLVIGFIQLYYHRNSCQRRSKLSVVIFWIATGLVLLLVLFPQIAASLLAG